MAILLLSAADGSAAAVLPWAIDESVYAGSDPVFQADLIDFDYDSTITTTATTFSEAGDFRIRQYAAGFIPGVSAGAPVGPDMLANTYVLWGKWDIAGAITGADFMITQGNIWLFIDLSPDNGSRDADVLLGTAAHLSSGSGTLAPLTFDGIYDDFTLSANGAQYWVDPAPFHSSIRFTGTTTFTEETGPGVYYTKGTGTGYFVTPEPSTFLMLITSLAGLSGVRRVR